MPADKEKAPPGGSGASSKFIAVNGDGSDTTVDLPVSQLLLRNARPEEIPELRAIWWRQAALGHRLPAEINVIVIPGGAT